MACRLVGAKPLPEPMLEYGSSNGLAASRRHAISWTNGDTVDWRIYAALEEMGKQFAIGNIYTLPTETPQEIIGI